MKTSNDLKRDNTSLILHTVQQNGAISKNKMASYTGLSQVTVHKIVNELVALGICVESGDRVSTGGRNAALFRLNGAYGVILGQTVYRHRILTVACDFSLKRLYQCEVDNDIADMAGSIQVMFQELRRAMDALQGWKMLGIGVSLPGRSTPEGVVTYIPGFDAWKHVPLRSALEQEFGLPVSVDNDNNALAIAAKYNGLTSRFSDYVYLQVFEGIGTGVVIDNRLFRGRNGAGCEIGHTSIMLNGPLCTCGNHGCLEAFLCDSHLLACIGAKCAASDAPAPRDISEAIRQAKERADSPAAGVFYEASRYISIAIEHIFRIFDTQAVILRCQWLSGMPELFQQVSNTVFSDLPWVRRDRFFILLDEDDEIMKSAAACIFLDRFYMADGIDG